LPPVNPYANQKYAEIIYDFAEMMHPTTIKTNSNQGMIVLKQGPPITSRQYTMGKKIQLQVFFQTK